AWLRQTPFLKPSFDPLRFVARFSAKNRSAVRSLWKKNEQITPSCGPQEGVRRIGARSKPSCLFYVTVPRRKARRNEHLCGDVHQRLLLDQDRHLVRALHVDCLLRWLLDTTRTTPAQSYVDYLARHQCGVDGHRLPIDGQVSLRCNVANHQQANDLPLLKA